MLSLLQFIDKIDTSIQGDSISVMSFYTRYIFHIIISITLVNYAAGFEAEKDVFFELYTREEPRNYFLLKPSDGDSISQTTFKTTRPTRIFVHGYRSKRKVIERYAEGFLSIGDFNFIAVNWQEGSSTVNYYSAKRRVKQVSAIFSNKQNLTMCFLTNKYFAN